MSTAATERSIKGDSPTDQERAVGITLMVSPNVPGFNCTIKHRYTDFLVNEISPDGHVLHLTDLGGKLARVDQGNDKAESSTDLRNGNVQAEHTPGTTLETSTSKRPNREEDDMIIDGATQSRKKPRIEQNDDQSTLEATAVLEVENADMSNEDRITGIMSNVSESDQHLLHDIFGEQVTNRILKLYANVIIHPDRKPRDQPFVCSDAISEKSKRTDAHVAIRRIFSSKLETATLQDLPGVVSIKAASTKGPSGARGRPPIDSNGGAIPKGKLGWDELGGEYLHFSLYKENKDTMEVLYHIASRLKVPVKNFEFAGTKDRRAVTVQRVAIFRVHAERIAELNKSARGWRVGNFEYKKHGLELGELGGNEFLLTLRDCYFKGEESMLHEQKLILARRMLEKASESFVEHGFLNYYGLQRFGSFSTGTHVTGHKMLSGDLEAAVNSILAYDKDLLSIDKNAASSRIPQDDIDRAEAIKLWHAGKTKDAVAKMPKRFQAEAAIIQYLGKKNRKTGEFVQDRDWQGALTHIPRNLRMMYVHAYQSFIWNTVAGKRWELYGNKVVEGDLVVIGEKDSHSGAKGEEVDEDGEPIFHPEAVDSAPSLEDSFTRARRLSKAEAESGKYDIFDIVLPLPGYDVVYPGNAIGTFFEEFMSSETGGEIDPYKMRRSWKDISLSGAYRKMMAHPKDGFAFEIKSYAADEEQMVETDLDRIQKQLPARDEADVELNGQTSRPSNVTQTKKIAIVLKLGLGSSQYATMALRELTKGGAAHFKPDYSTR